MNSNFVYPQHIAEEKRGYFYKGGELYKVYKFYFNDGGVSVAILHDDVLLLEYRSSETRIDSELNSSCLCVPVSFIPYDSFSKIEYEEKK